MKVYLQSPQISCLSAIYNRFYASSKLKKWMCELCTFLQIWSQMYTYMYTYMYAYAYALDQVLFQYQVVITVLILVLEV